MAYQAADIQFGNRTWCIYTGSVDALSKDAPAAWGCVVISPSNEEKIAQGNIPPAVDDRHRAELMAAIRGLHFVPEGAAAVFVTDSPYVNDGLRFQKHNSISQPNDNPLDVTSLWAQLLALLEKRTVSFGEISLTTETHAVRAIELAQEASDAYAAGLMPLSTSYFTEFEAAGSPGSMTVSPSGCGVIIVMALAGGILVAILSLLLKGVF